MSLKLSEYARTGSRGAPVEIHNKAAWEAARRANIIANARKGRMTRWLEADASREDLIKWMRTQNGGFIGKMLDSLDEWGSLTEKQEQAIRAMRTKQASARQERRERDSASIHFGEIGQRLDFDITVHVSTSFETDFGTMHLTFGRDQAGNVIGYKGSRRLGHVGDRIKVRGTVKAHGEREGVKQTLIARPGKIER